MRQRNTPGLLARRRQRFDERGSSIVEFAILLPVMLLFLYGLIEFGMIFAIKHGLTETAADAARAASTSSPQSTATTTALSQVNSTLSGNVGGLIGSSCSTAAMQCTATVAQCPNEPTGYNCLTVTLTYTRSYDSNGVVPDLLGIAPTVSSSATVLLSGNLTS